MRLKFSLLILVLIGISSTYAQAQKISFSETTYDFGTIGDRDGKVSHEFKITNDSDQPLVISRVVASCGCTSPNWTKEPIEPGHSGFINVVYNPAGNQGNITKTVRVTTNIEPTNTTLYIKANVLKGNADPTSTYPISFGDLLFKEAPVLDFGQMDIKEKKTIEIEAYNNSTENISDIFSLPTYISVEPTTLPSKLKIVLKFVFDAEKYNQVGLIDGVVNINNQKESIIPYQGIVYENFEHLSPDEVKKMGKINLNSSSLIFNKDSKNNSATLKIANSGKSNLNIKGIQSQNKDITFSKKSITIKPNKIEEIKVNYPINKIKNPEASSTIYILSDDPKQPLKEINVIVNP